MITLPEQKSTIGKQGQFLVCLALIDNIKNCASHGITVADLEDIYAENKDLWALVGKVSEDKHFDSMWSRMFQKLARFNIIAEKSKSPLAYVKGEKFEEVQNLVKDISEALVLDVEGGFDERSSEQIIKLIATGEIVVSVLEVEGDDQGNEEKLHFLTQEQIVRLAKLAVEYSYKG